MGHFFFISTSYIISAVVLSLLSIYLIMSYYKNKRLFETLEDEAKSHNTTSENE